MINPFRKCSGIIGIFILLMLTLSAVVLVLEGCTSQVVGPKSQATPGERLSVSEGKTVVFLRMKGSIETKLFEEVPFMSGTDEKGFGISLKPRGGSATPVLVQFHSIDFAETGEKGWLYFSSDPGNYELKFMQNSGKGQKALLPSFILRIPPQKSAVYAGSVHFSCPREKQGFGARIWGSAKILRYGMRAKLLRIWQSPSSVNPCQIFVSILEAKEGGMYSAGLIPKLVSPGFGDRQHQ